MEKYTNNTEAYVKHDKVDRAELESNDIQALLNLFILSVIYYF